jgi:hypothetical protein
VSAVWGEDSLPEVCPACGQKWKHCEDFPRHLDELDQDEEPTGTPPRGPVIARRYSRDDSWLCTRPPVGWRCTRGLHLDGPCAAVTAWWNWSRFARLVRRGAR